MKVNGPLEYMQLEAFSGTGAVTGPAVSGRMFQDVSGTLAVPYFHDNTQWRQVQLFNPPTLKTQNSGTAVTVNWATGLLQQVVLTGHCVITFSNPQPGQVHTLIVTQRELYNVGALLTPYRFTFAMPDQDPARGPYQPVGVIQTGESQRYSWLYSTGIKAGYATIPARAGAVNTGLLNLTTATLASDFSPDGRFAVTTTSSATGSQILSPTDGGGLLSWGGPTQLGSSVGQLCVGAAILAHSQTQVFATTASPFIKAIQMFAGAFSSVGFWANPGTLPAGAAQCIAAHPAGTAVVVGHTTTPFMSGYPVLSGAFGTIYANPGTLPAAQVNSAAFSPQGDYLAVASQTTPFLQVYPFDAVTGYGTVVANPSSLPAGGPAGAIGKGVAWRPQGDFIAIAMTTTPFLYVVPFNRSTGAYGTPLTTTTVPSAALTSVQWTPDGQYLVTTSGTSPFLSIYDFSASLLNTTVALDSSNPGGAANDVSIHPSGEFCLLGLNATPFLQMYPLPRKVRNYLRLP